MIDTAWCTVWWWGWSLQCFAGQDAWWHRSLQWVEGDDAWWFRCLHEYFCQRVAGVWTAWDKVDFSSVLLMVLLNDDVWVTDSMYSVKPRASVGWSSMSHCQLGCWWSDVLQLDERLQVLTKRWTGCVNSNDTQLQMNVMISACLDVRTM